MAVATGLLASGAAAIPVGLETLAATGLQAAGTAPGTVYATLSRPVVNAAGETAWRGNLEPGTGDAAPDGSDASGIWSSSGGLVAREGEAAPGAPGFEYRSLLAPQISSSGEIVFRATFRDASGNPVANEGSYRFAGAGAVPIVVTGDLLPGGGSYVNGQPDIEGSQVIVDAFPSADGVFSAGSGGALATILRTGDAAPLVAGAVIDTVNASSLDASGAMTLSVDLEAGVGGVDASNDQIDYLRDAAGSYSVVYREGAAAPACCGTITGGGPVILNSAGEMAFVGSTIGPGFLPAAQNLYGPAATGGFALVGRTGFAAPGTPARFSGFSTPRLNDAGEMAFRGFLQGGDVLPDFSNSQGLWRRDAAGALDLVMRAGDPVPDLLGVTFLDPDDPALDPDGSVVFVAGIDEAGAIGEGLFLATRAGGFHTLVRSGDLLEVAPGDLRVVADLSIYGGFGAEHLDSVASGGLIGFHATFTDGTQGIFLATVPEPGASLLLGVAAAWLARRFFGPAPATDRSACRVKTPNDGR